MSEGHLDNAVVRKNVAGSCRGMDLCCAEEGGTYDAPSAGGGSWDDEEAQFPDEAKDRSEKMEDEDLEPGCRDHQVALDVEILPAGSVDVEEVPRDDGPETGRASQKLILDDQTVHAGGS